MSNFLTVAEVYRMQHTLIDRFGGLHGVRDKGAVDAAIFRPQIGYYSTIEEEGAVLMESLCNNHGFVDGNKRIAFAAADVFLRVNRFCLEVEGSEGDVFITGSMERHEFRMPQILEWIRQHIKPLSGAK